MQEEGARSGTGQSAYSCCRNEYGYAEKQENPDEQYHGYQRRIFYPGQVCGEDRVSAEGYYLGTYGNIDDAIEARRKGEELLHTGMVEYYSRWKELADADPEWGAENPISIRVERNSYGELKVWFDPAI